MIYLQNEHGIKYNELIVAMGVHEQSSTCSHGTLDLSPSFSTLSGRCSTTACSALCNR